MSEPRICACPVSDPYDCLALRYGVVERGQRYEGLEDACNCVCHHYDAMDHEDDSPTDILDDSR